MIKIPLVKADLPPYEAIEGPFKEIFENGRITNFGKYVTLFEKESSLYLGTDVVTLSSGTMALILALQSLGLKQRQKVILPSFTFMATAQAVLYAGGIPLFADIDKDLTLALPDLEVLLAKHKDVKAVLPVHTYGLPCKVDEIQKIVSAASRKRSMPIALLYDAAHAFGSSVNGKKIGGFGNAEAFSLSVTKTLVSVEGGMVSSRDSRLIGDIRKMRNYGIEANYDTSRQGLNGKMSEFHAIIGLYNLRRLDVLLEERKRKAGYYLKEISSRTIFETQPSRKGAGHTYKDFTVFIPGDKASRRDAIMNFLNEKGIETNTYFYPPIHRQKFFSPFSRRPLPRTEDISAKVINVPFYASITEDEMNYVVEMLKEAERLFL